jgi:hypothetical protein
VRDKISNYLGSLSISAAQLTTFDDHVQSFLFKRMSGEKTELTEICSAVEKLDYR